MKPYLLIALLTLTGCAQTQSRAVADTGATTITVTYAGFAAGSYVGCTAVGWTLPVPHLPPYTPPGDATQVVTTDPACWQAQDLIAKAAFK